MMPVNSRDESFPAVSCSSQNFVTNSRTRRTVREDEELERGTEKDSGPN
jgi:hypothetical protein